MTVLRVTVAALCLAACLLSCVTHDDTGRHIIAEHSLVRVVFPWPWLTAACVACVCVASAVVAHRPGRPWAWPVVLLAWLLWIAVGRVVSVDLMSGAVDGHWYVFTTDRHSLRPVDVQGAQYTCDARAQARGWWVDLEYAGAREAVWLGPFIASEATAELRKLFAQCR